LPSPPAAKATLVGYFESVGWFRGMLIAAALLSLIVAALLSLIGLSLIVAGRRSR
jgi:hypothetical protein